MIYQLGDRNVIFNSGANRPGDVLQRRERDGWKDYRVNDEVMKAPVEVYSLPPGEYRLVSSG
jgi:hypothetical protein